MFFLYVCLLVLCQSSAFQAGSLVGIWSACAWYTAAF